MLSKLGEEPPWPTLLSTFEDREAVPFVPQWIDHARTHHLLPLDDAGPLSSLWSVGEREKAQNWLSGKLHFDFANFPRYWGSVHLLAPNPVYRQLVTRLQRNTGPAESVLCRFQPRADREVNGLVLTIAEQEGIGLKTMLRTRVKSPLMRVGFGHEVSSISVNVWDTERGYLEASDSSYTFIRSIGFSLSLAQTTVVQLPNQSFEVSRSGKPEVSVIGDGRSGTDSSSAVRLAPTGEQTAGIPSSRSRLLEAYWGRRQQITAESHGQKWFRWQKEEAHALLQGLLNEATESVLLVDPYFAALELVRFGLAVGRYDIPIRILTSAKVLKKRVAKDGPKEKGELLLETLREAQAHERMNPFEIRVMIGEHPAIHDRFLMIDRRIWLLGSSLNEFGSRGTMMLAIPDPDGVRGALLRAWDESKAHEISCWVEQRRANRQSREDETK